MDISVLTYFVSYTVGFLSILQRVGRVCWDALGEVIVGGLRGKLELGCLGFILRFDELEYNMPIRL